MKENGDSLSGWSVSFGAKHFAMMKIVACLILTGTLIILAQSVFAQSGNRPVERLTEIEFIDSATGFAIQPESISAQPEDAGRSERRFRRSDVSKSGRASLSLEQGRHLLTASSPDYHSVSGPLRVRENNPYRIRVLLDPIEAPRELRREAVELLHRDDATLIQGFVADEESRQPLSGVRVRSLPSGVETSSDARGFFRLQVPLQTQEEHAAAPASLILEKPGYRGKERQYLELWPRGDSTYTIRLERGTGREIIDERTLRRNNSYSDELLSDSKEVDAGTSAKLAAVSSDEDSIVIPQATVGSNATVRVPRNIRVEKAGVIYYVTFNYYMKQVLPSEWIRSWHTNSLNAGAVAVRSYAMARYHNTSPTADYDICGSSNCQQFDPGDTSGATDRAVDYTDNYVLINSSGTVVSTEYSSENNSLNRPCGDGFTAPSGGCIYDPICTGKERNGHGRGMCQRGSYRWAKGTVNEAGVFPQRWWTWILKHYYPDLILVKGAVLVIGDDIKARTANSCQVRACGDGGITNGINCTLITTKAAGDTGVIIGGPTVVTNDGKGFTWYQVQWNDASSTVGWSCENFLMRVFPSPTAPTHLTAVAVATNQINLSWIDTSDFETGFLVERAPGTNGPWIEIAGVTVDTTSFSDLNLHSASTWYYRVRSYNGNGYSGYSGVTNAKTFSVPPTVAPVSDRTVAPNTLVTITNIGSAPDRVQLITDFDAFVSETANGVVLFRKPTHSTSTTNFLNGIPEMDIAAVVDNSYPASGQAAGNVLKIKCEFTNDSNPWLRLTTAGTAAFPNPVIDFTKKLQFDIYSDKTIKIAVGCRETTTVAGTAIGANGGTTGAIEWAGATNVSGTAPMPNRSISAGSWQTLTFDFASEPVRNFSGGNGILSTASGLGVLEHLAIVPTEGTNIYNIYLDNFTVLYPRPLTYSLGAGAPTNAIINTTNGIFSWTPTGSQAPSTNLIAVIVSDNSVPALKVTNTFTIYVSDAPIVITSHPADAIVAVGSNVTFNVEATGDALKYQWCWNGNSLSGETSSTMTLNNVQLTNGGNYSVIVSNALYSATSTNALLTVVEPVQIVRQPQTRTNNVWDNAFFSVTATGTPELNYQWQFNGINISGATGSALNFTIASTNSAGTYTVLVSNPAGTNVSSGAALHLPYGHLERITQWDFNSIPPDGADSTGVFTPSFGSGTLAGPLTNGVVGAMTVNNWLTGSTSDPASLGTDNSGRSLTRPRQTAPDKSAGFGFNASTVGYKDIAVTWELYVGSRACAYWRGQYTTNGTDWIDRVVVDKRIPYMALNASSYDIYHDDLSGVEGVKNNPSFAYRIVAEWESSATGSGADAYVPADANDTYNNTGNPISRWDMVTVLGTPFGPPVIVESPSSLEKVIGDTAVFTAAASGTVSAVVWTRDGTPVGFGNISVEDGITFSTLTLESVQASDAGTYIATFFNDDAPEGTSSDSATLTVFDPLIITSQPVDVSTNLGATVTFAVAAIGSGTVAYQWRFNETNDLADGEVVTGATSASLTLAGVSSINKGSYSVEVNNGFEFVVSSNAVLTLLGGPQITNLSPNHGTLNQGESATFQVFATGENLAYQWYFGGTLIHGATGSSYTRVNVQPSDGGIDFTVVVSNEADSVTSNPRKIGLVIPDTAPPTVSVLTPKPNSAITQPSINVTGVVKDGRGLFLGSGIVTGVIIVHNAGLPGGSTNAATLTDVSAGTLGKYNFASASPIALLPGTNTLHVYAMDLAGNPSTNLAPFVFYYDTTDTVKLVVSAGGQVKMGTTVWNSATTNNLSIFKVGRSYTLDAFVNKGANYVFTNWVTGPIDVGSSVLETNWVQKSKLTFIVQSNMTIHANFITNPFTPVAGTYNGLFYDPENVMSHASAGFVTIKIKDKSTYTGTLSFDGDKIPFSGRFTASGNMTRTVARSKVGKGPLTLSLALDWSTLNDQVTGTVSDGAWTSELNALKAVLSNTSSVGNYTVLIPRDDETGYPANSPGGIGSGSITNDSRGFGKLALTVGDVDKSQKATFKTSLSKDGEWPLYVPLYQSTTAFTNAYLGNIVSSKKEFLGSVMGWVTFFSSNAAPACAELTWIKTTLPGSANYVLTKPTNRFFYATGFSNQVPLLASPYKIPSSSEPPINFTSAQVVVGDGNLSEPVTNMATVISSNKVTLSATNTIGVSNKMTITFNKKLGTFAGSFLRPGDGMKTDFVGALLQNTTNASGHFLGTNQSGSVIVTGN